MAGTGTSAGARGLSPHRLAPRGQRACYLSWLRVSTALRNALTFPWAPEAWREDRKLFPILAVRTARHPPPWVQGDGGWRRSKQTSSESPGQSHLLNRISRADQLPLLAPRLHRRPAGDQRRGALGAILETASRSWRSALVRAASRVVIRSTPHCQSSRQPQACVERQPAQTRAAPSPARAGAGEG